MEYKYLNLFLLFTITILLVMTFLLNSSSKSFFADIGDEEVNNINNAIKTATKKDILEDPRNNSSNSNQDESIQKMTENLLNAESLCEEMESRAENRRLLNQYKENNRVIQLLADQKKRIEELTNVVNYLRKEQSKRNTMINECRADTQQDLNTDVNIMKTVLENGLIQDPVKLKLGVTEDLKEELYNFAYDQGVKSQCPKSNPDTHIDVEKLEDKCVGCDANVLKNTNLSVFE